MRTAPAARLFARIILGAPLAAGVLHAAERENQTYEQRATLPGQEPGRSEADAVAAQRVGAESPQIVPPADTSAAPRPPTPAEFRYRPLYPPNGDATDDELIGLKALGAAGSRPHQDYSAMAVLTLGGGVSFGHLGYDWQFGPAGHGLTSIDASFVPFVSRSFAWLGFWAATSRDSALERSRLGLGLESGIGPWGLNVGPLFKVGGAGKGRAALEARISFSVPVWYSRPDYAHACCPRGSDLRSCACARVVTTWLLEPDVRMELWPDEPREAVRFFAGLSGKFGLAY